MNKIEGKTLNIVNENVEGLKQLFPEVFVENKIDFDKLQNLLGNYIDTGIEKYQMTWKGKMDAIRLVQKQSTGTLRPCIEESKNWDKTENLYIEGDNLEVLKLLQSSYLNKIKMIYIDPPYNTGNDFVYEDDFADNISNYKKITEQATKSNPETAGRYHTNWLNMMYPRLKLARNLLTDDGVIFISIDDNEQANLKKICDEIFGEDNFVANIIWEKKYSPSNDSKVISATHDFVLCYTKKIEIWDMGLLDRTDEMNQRYKNYDNDPRGVWKPGGLSAKTYSAKYDYPVTTPNGKIVNPPTGSCWQVSKEKLQELIKDNRIYFGVNGDSKPQIKQFLSEVKQGMVPKTIWFKEEVGHGQISRKEVTDLFGMFVFDNPKPVKMIKKMLKIANLKENDIILDFFSGSATTAQAVMEFSSYHKIKNLKFIMVQLPEKVDENSEAYKAGFKNICEIGKERIRRAGDELLRKIASGHGRSDGTGYGMGIDNFEEYERLTGETVLDNGFKIFKLDSSNILAWDNTPTTDESEIEKRIQNSMFYLKENRKDIDVVYEIMLKNGLSLTLPVAKHTIKDVECYVVDNPAYKVLICLQPNITLESVEAMLKELDVIGTFIFADKCFSDANALINTREILKREERKMRLF